MVAAGAGQRPPGRHLHAVDRRPGRHAHHPRLGQHRGRTRSSSATPTGRLHLHRLQDARVRRRRRGLPHRLLPAVDERAGRAGRARRRRPQRRPHAHARRPGRRPTTTRSSPPAASGAIRNYVINVLDTGAPDDGVDELAIHGLRRATTDVQRLARLEPSASTPTTLPLRRARNADRARPTTRRSSPCCTATVGGYRSRVVGDEPSNDVQRINYDTALNGRLTRLRPRRQRPLLRRRQQRRSPRSTAARATTPSRSARSSAPSATSADGGAAAAGRLPRPDRHHPRLAQPGHARAAGGHRRHRQRRVHRLLQPGRAAPRRRRRQRPVRRPGVRAAAVSTPTPTATACTSTTSTPSGTANADRQRRRRASTPPTAAPTHRRDTWRGRRDASTQGRPTAWRRPIIGLGFSTGRPLDIRAGGGEDEVSVQRQRPGLGRRRHRLRQAGRARHRVRRRHRHHRRSGIFGAGLNVRYTTVEVVEVDGLEGDDEFFVQSTAFGVAYRVIGGLGSDTHQRHRRRHRGHRRARARRASAARSTIASARPTDPYYDGLPVDGLDYNVATPDSGKVIIDDEGPRGHVGARGRLGVARRPIDRYSVRLAGAARARRVRHRLRGALAAGGGRQPAGQPAADSLPNGAGRHALGVHGRRAPRPATTSASSSASSGSTACCATRPTAPSC